jgi:sugar lactone lactonase YvrE
MISKKFYPIKNTLLAGLVTLACVYTSCNKSTETETVIPTTTTTQIIANVTPTTALSGGTITNLGSSFTLAATGVCYSATNQNPTVADAKTSDGTNYVFKSPVTGLTANTTYYLRAYIQNDAGIGYGNVVKFTTSATTADTTVTVTTLAGNGTPGLANGTGTAAAFNNPQGTAVDAAGNVYVSDSFNHLIRKITPAGVATTFAGTGTLGFTGGTTSTAQFYSPQGLAFDGTGNLYVADQGNNAIYKITPAGTVTILAGTGLAGYVNGAGTIARFNSPQGIAVDAAGNIYVADRNDNMIRKVTPAGIVSTFAGTGGYALTDGDGPTVATFNRPVGVAVDAAGNVYVTDQGNTALRKITPAGAVTTLIGNTTTTALLNTLSGIAIDAQGNLYITDQTGRILFINTQNILYTLAGKANTSGFLDGSKTTALFSGPTSIAVDAGKNIYVTDYNNNRVRKLVVTTR